MQPTSILRLEGVAVFIAALAGFLAIDGRLWLLALLALAPDLAMLASLAGKRYGSYGYNVTHTYVAPSSSAESGSGRTSRSPPRRHSSGQRTSGPTERSGTASSTPTSVRHTHLLSNPDPPTPDTVLEPDDDATPVHAN